MKKRPTYEDLEQRVKILEQETARTKMEKEALIRDQEKFLKVLDSIEDEYYEVDLKGNYVFANQAACRNQGLAREELIGLNFKDYTRPEEADRLFKIFNEVYKTGQPSGLFEYEVVRRDGQVAYFEDNVSLLRDEGGRPIGFAGVARNISHKKTVEVDLRRNEKEYRKILEFLPDAVVISSLEDGRFIMVNSVFCTLSGFKEEEVLGKTPWDLDLLVNRGELEELFKKLMENQGEVFGFEMQFRNKDRGIEDVLYSSRPIRYQGVIRLLSVGTIVTPLKEAQRALRKSEEKYRRILEKMEEGYYEVDLAGRMIFANEAECKIHDLPREELIGLSNRVYMTPETAKQIYEIYNRIYRTGVPEKIFNYEIFNKSGKVKNLETSASLLFDDTGAPRGFWGITRDVTERIKAEKALRESEEKYRTILNGLEESYYEVDLAGNFVFFNEAICKSYGRTYDELMGMNYKEYVFPGDVEKVFSVFNQVFRTGIPTAILDFRIVRIDGEIRTIEGSVALLRNAQGAPTGFHGICRDRTEQKKAEAALADSEEKYRLLVENANDGIYILQEGTIRFANPMMARLTGIPVRELEGTALIDWVLTADRGGFLHREIKVLTGEQRPAPHTFRLVNNRNETLWAEVNTVDIQWEGRPATLNFLRDITMQKKMEAHFQQVQKMEAVGTLAGGIAHDFNNLLMGIQGNASLVMLDLNPGHPHFDKLKSIEQQVQTGTELTRRLLGSARGGKYEVKPTDMNQLTGRVLEMFGRTRKEITIHPYFQEEVMAVEVDRSQMEQVLLNLFINAGHAMPGGGDLYVETKNVYLDEAYVGPYDLGPGQYVRISVTDTGVGMDTETQRRAFDPFFTTKEMGRGTGLGLASAYGIIKNHNGIINIYSEKGQGTTFNIYLPVSAKEIREEAPPKEQTLRGEENILFVDDEEAIVQIGSQLLERLGYRVMKCRSGQEALDLYQKEWEGIDLIILDMIMPGMAGGETFNRLKEVNPAVRVILSSGYSLNGQAKEILDRGCMGFLQKPFSLSDLSQKVRQVLDAKGEAGGHGR
jgi:PAS domain S-box-containing protein